MLNTQKLLYILPDVAYVAELLPDKQPSSFSIQSFRQINGEFIDDNEFLSENVLKLFSKLDSNEFHLILPDFLFTNTIVSVAEKSETKINQHIKEKLLPSLNLSKDTHDVETAIMTQLKDEAKVQLSAIEKSLLDPIRAAAKESKIQISAISPLSWTVKSIVSLEPSITVVQIGSMLYIAEHYIGVDQTSSAKADQVENIFETIKTLKGSEPSIQTVYLLTNQLVEDELKKHLSDTLPIQQLSSKEEDSSKDASTDAEKMPSHVQKIIESGMKTISISDYPVPKFPLGKTMTKTPSPSTDSKEEKDEPKLDSKNIDIPKPSHLEASTTKTESDAKTTKDDFEDKLKDDKENIVQKADKVKTTTESLDGAPPTEKSATPTTDGSASGAQTKDKSDDDFKELLSHLKSDGKKDHADKDKFKDPLSKQKKNSMLKMVFVTLAVFFATVGIGVGIGLGVLSLSQKNNTEEPTSPTVDAEASPVAVASPSPTPEPSPVVEIDKEELTILVVNATTIAGHAGETKKALEDDGFTDIQAGNAKGEYEDGFYVLMEEEDEDFIAALEEATELELIFQEDVAIEDPKDAYDAVIVLAE